MNKALGHNVATDSGATSFVPSTAKAIGKSETTIRLDAERGTKINGVAGGKAGERGRQKIALTDSVDAVPENAKRAKSSAHQPMNRPSNERNSRCVAAVGCSDHCRTASLIIIGLFAASRTIKPATLAQRSSCPPGG